MSIKKLHRMSLSSVLKDVLPAQRIAEQYIYGVTTDSRQVEAGFLFIASVGRSVDARLFVLSAIEKGASAVVYESSVAASAEVNQQLVAAREQGVVTFALDDCNKHIGNIVAQYYMHPSLQMNIVGVTGTNGKSSCVSIMSQALHAFEHKVGVVGTLGWGMVDKLKSTNMTTPDIVTLQSYCASLRDEGAQSMALEISSHALDQNRIQGLNVDIAVFVNLTRDHLDYHNDFESYAKAKLSLFLRP